MTAGSSTSDRSAGAPQSVIDVHVHVFPPEVIRRRDEYVGKDEWFRTLYEDPASRMVTYDRVLEEMDATGVDRSVVFGFAYKDQALCREANDYVLEAVDAHPDRFIGFACVSPERPGAMEELERCLDAGMRGVGELFPDGQGLDLRQEGGGLDRVAAAAAERGAAVNLHANEPVGHHYPGKGDNTPGPAFDFARRHPDLDIIYAHMGGGLFFYEMMPSAQETLRRVYYDTSAVPYLYRRDVYSLAATAAGPGKILFGSDYPLISPERYLRDTEDLDADLRGALLGGNAEALLGDRRPDRVSSAPEPSGGTA